MIELSLPRDVRKINDRFLGPFSKRQVVCTSLGGFVGVTVLYLTHLFLPGDIPIILGGICGVPFIICGIKKKYNLPYEKFFFNVILSKKKRPVKRAYIRQNWMRSLMEQLDENGELISEEELEKRKLEKEKKEYEIKKRKESKKWKPLPKVKCKNKDYECFF